MVYLAVDATSSRSCRALVLIMSAASLLWFPYPCSAGELISHNCSRGGNYSADSQYKFNLDQLLGKMKTESSKTGFYNDTEGTDNDQVVYGSYLCQGDLTPQNCSDCIQGAVDAVIANCSNQIKTQIWFDQCILQYSNEPFFGTWQTDYMAWCSPHNFSSTQAPQLQEVLNETLTKVFNQAAGDETPGRKFATREVNLTFNGSNTMYTLAQCVPDLSSDICLQCLNQGMNWLFDWCTGKTGGRTISSSCFLRYEMSRFYREVPALAPAPAPAPAPVFSPPPSYPKANQSVAPPPLPHHHKGHRLSPTLQIVVILASVVILLSLGVWCYLHNYKRTKMAQTDFEGIEITSAETFQMDFSKVRAATKIFAPDKKLGEGGFGDVFKGELENGKEIAVKRLITSNSGQGTAEFKNEVALVAKLQHRNLVKLLGFCLTGKEKILVYEYLPNSSLDKVLFDPIKRTSLNWEKRFNIICGIAKGLLYLHQDSRLRIIHRDLKSSNILLDEAMNPKISDFGIAKMLALDQTRASTDTLAGTYAYMAPEYMLIGQYSLKSDIYSFGILVLEIVTGQRNILIGRPMIEEALLHRAWRLWSANAMLEMVDSTLNDTYFTEEVVQCIHIGLLCIQVDSGKRPTMSSIVAALSGKSMDLPTPTPPTFFDANCSSSTTNTTTSAATGNTQSSLP